MVGGGKPPLILNYSMRQKLVVTFTHTDRFTPGEQAPSTNRTEGWLRSRAVALDALEKKKIGFPCKEMNHDPSIVNPIA